MTFSSVPFQVLFYFLLFLFVVLFSIFWDCRRLGGSNRQSATVMSSAEATEVTVKNNIEDWVEVKSP